MKPDIFLFTGQTTGRKLTEIKKRGMGICISTSPGTMPVKGYGEVPCFLDNGAYACWRKGYPFQSDLYKRTVERCYKHSIKLEFFVLPDIIGKGNISLDFSLKWADTFFVGVPNLALPVQDGVSYEEVENILLSREFTHIFVGGTLEWKGNTAEHWVSLAHRMNIRCHVGRVGQFPSMQRMRNIGVDSIDSSSWCRNESWHIVDKFLEWEGTHNV